MERCMRWEEYGTNSQERQQQAKMGDSDLGHGRKRKFEECSGVSVLSEAPKEIQILQFATARASEIAALSTSCETISCSKRVFQTLPHHMRRRAMSHTMKRLPRRLREQAAREYDDLKEKEKQSRRHRRRPKNLLSEYSRRRRTHCWLETHVWHAKRFKMANCWGYRVPLHPNEKSLRACYRAMVRHCLLQDVSYLCCIELKGPESLILRGLIHLTSPDTGKTFAAKSSLNGSREGETVLYSFQKYPYDAIGCVTFLWKPNSLSNSEQIQQTDFDENRQLWLWCHPSCYNQVWDELCKAFAMPSHVSESGDTSTEAATLENPRTTSGPVALTSLKDNLLRYRMWGPLSQAVLSDLLQKPILKTSTSHSSSGWWKCFYRDKISLETQEKQWKTWNSVKECQSPSELPPHCVMSLTVRDPRILLPPKKTKVMNNCGSDTINEQTTPGKGASHSTFPQPTSAISPLWEAGVREAVKEKLSEHEINEKRSKFLIPGSHLKLGDRESRIPVILIQRPGELGSEKSVFKAKMAFPPKPSGVFPGFASGWDIILPSGWGMAFWISLVYRGARVGGTREAENVQKESGALYFPLDYPDTAACRLEQEAQTKELEEKHGRYPPGKCPNFVKLGITEPYCCPWQRLVDEWSEQHLQILKSCDISHSDDRVTENPPHKDFFVLRDKSKLSLLISKISGNSADLSEEFQTFLKNTIVPVKVTMHRKGKPAKFAAICLPVEDDLQKLLGNPSYDGPIEPAHKDVSKGMSKQKKKKKKKKRQAAEISTTEPCAKLGLSGSLLSSSSRQIIGFINNGGFSLSRGFGTGLGFCSALGLLQMKSPFVGVIRAQNSFQYRFVHIEIIL